MSGESGPGPILRIAAGYRAAKMLFTASKLGLFEALKAGPADLAELNARTKLPTHTLRMVAAAMVSLGLLELEGGEYANTPAVRHLSGEAQPDLRAWIRLCDEVCYPMWQRFAECVEADSSATAGATFGAEQAAIFFDGVEALTLGAAKSLDATYDFSNHERVIDLGGGNGSFLRALLGANPELRGTLYEQPPVVEMARRRFDGHPAAERVELVAGDFLFDPLPRDHDVALLSSVVHCFGERANRHLLGRVREVAPEGMRLLLIDFWTDSTRTQPEAATLMAGEFLMFTGDGDVYSVEQVSEWLSETGWRMVEHRDLFGPQSLIIAEAQDAT